MTKRKKRNGLFRNHKRDTCEGDVMESALQLASARGGVGDSVGCRSTEQSAGGSEGAESGQARRD